jgi:hypothetical protein
MKISHDAVASWGTGKSTNADSSAGYQRLASNAASSITIINSSMYPVSLRKYGTSDDPIEIDFGVILPLPLQGNTDEIEWKRTDAAASTADIHFAYSL